MNVEMKELVKADDCASSKTVQETQKQENCSVNDTMESGYEVGKGFKVSIPFRTRKITKKTQAKSFNKNKTPKAQALSQKN